MAFTKHALLAGSCITAASILSGCGKGPSISAVEANPAGGPVISGTAVGDTTAKDNPGPVRMARVSNETGKVSWRPDATTDWGALAVNLPIRQGAQVWLAPNSSCELQFDDGSTVQLGNAAVATIQTLYSDNQGEFTEVKLAAGTSSWDLKNKYSIYQVDAPCDSVKSVGPSEFRVDVNPKACSLAVRGGNATITADNKDTPVSAGHDVLLSSDTDPVVVQSVGAPDTWDQAAEHRDALLSEAPSHVPENIAIVSGGLDHYGGWHNVPNAGWVWSPTVEASWRPYHQGHWAWVDPYGWTWVSADPWGWAPYHYGAWGHYGFGWGWAPGPAVQYWSPARVDFVTTNGYVTWAPYAPEEVSYPSFSVGFGGGNWWLNFSIGGCGVYEPYGGGICRPVAYPWGYYNSGSRRDGWGPNGWGQGRFEAVNGSFVPRNAAFGAVGVNERAFGNGAHYDAINRSASDTFRNGRQAGAGREAFSGPVGVRPGRSAFTPGGAIVSNARPAALNRGLVRGTVPANVARAGGSFGPEARGAAGHSNMAARGGQAPSGVAAARDSLGFKGRNGVTSAPGGARGATPGVRGGAAGVARNGAGSGAARTVDRRTAGVNRGNPAAGGRPAVTERSNRTGAGRNTAATNVRRTNTNGRDSAATAGRRTSARRTPAPARRTSTSRTRQSTPRPTTRRTPSSGRTAQHSSQGRSTQHNSTRSTGRSSGRQQSSGSHGGGNRSGGNRGGGNRGGGNRGGGNKGGGGGGDKRKGG